MSRNIDGLWVGTFESKPQLGLRRVGDALELIKRQNSLHYSRVIHNLDRVWVNILPDAGGVAEGGTDGDLEVSGSKARAS